METPSKGNRVKSDGDHGNSSSALYSSKVRQLCPRLFQFNSVCKSERTLYHEFQTERDFIIHSCLSISCINQLKYCIQNLIFKQGKLIEIFICNYIPHQIHVSMGIFLPCQLWNWFPSKYGIKRAHINWDSDFHLLLYRNMGAHRQWIQWYVLLRERPLVIQTLGLTHRSHWVNSTLTFKWCPTRPKRRSYSKGLTRPVAHILKRNIQEARP